MASIGRHPVNMISVTQSAAMALAPDDEVPVAAEWFVRRRVADGLTLISEPHVHPLLRCNVWLVTGREQSLVIDTAMGLAPCAVGCGNADLFARAAGLAAEGNSGAGLEMLVDRLQTFKTNDDFLAELGKA